MTQTARTFRIFVSSTFNDLKAERNALQERVFPRLRELAAKQGSRFQVIDLRWGVSDEASLDQQAMNICLGEIARCQQTTPRPNFIILLGDRYGWYPPSSQIPAKQYKKILGVVTDKNDLALLEEWYSLDKNAVPPEWRLNPRLRGGKYEKPADWQPVEAKLHKILAEAVKKLTLTKEEVLPFISSATDQEITAGALDVTDAPEHVSCFFRSIDGFPQKFNAQEFQTILTTKANRKFEGKDLDKAFRDLLKTLQEMGPDSSAKDFADHLQSALKQTPKSTTEEEFVSFIYQTLVDFTARDFLNLDEDDWAVDSGAFDQQIALKEQLEKHVPDNVHKYTAQWTGEGITTDHIDQLCEDVYNSLSRIIQKEIEHPHEIISTEKHVFQIQPDEFLNEEGRAHHKFAEERVRFFVGRTEMLADIGDYLRDSKGRIMAIVGAGGTGKSALIAKAIQQTQKSHSGKEIIYRFIGATAGSSDGRSLLDSLCREISRRYDADATDIPTDYRDLVPELGKRMGLASAEKPLILFLDSLDQLSLNQGARSLTWLPAELPEHVFIITSTREEDPLDYLKAKQARVETLHGLIHEEGDLLLTQWLENAGRALQDPQRAEVMNKFIKSEGNPLYLKLAFEEARLWVSDPTQPVEQLEPGVSGIIKKNMIDRLAQEDNHGEMLVSHALGYLAASRDGLAEDEMLDLLSRDIEVYRWFMEGSHHLPSDLIRSAIEYRSSQGKQEDKEKAAPGQDEESTAHDWLSDLIRSVIDYRKWQAKQDGKGAGGTSKDDERAALAWLKENRNPPEQVADFLKEVLPKAGGPRLPIVLWSRLSFDLAPYLSERMVDGSPLLSFFHRELGDVSTEAFLSGGQDQPYHARLADYFRFKADPQGDGSWEGNYPHGLSELPYHLTQAGRDDETFQTLTDFKFLEHKAAEVGIQTHKDKTGNMVNTYTGILQLQDDFEYAQNAKSGNGESGTGDQAPLIRTAEESDGKLMVYCPVCNNRSAITKEKLGEVITCPQASCSTKLKLNTFTIQPA